MIKKRVLSTILAAVLIFGMLPITAFAEDVDGDGYNDNDVDEISAFLGQGANALALGAECEADDPTTWTGITWTTDAEKRVQRIDWPNKGLGGALSLSNLTSLNYLDVNTNGLTSATITGCTMLETIYCNGNDLISLDLGGLDSLSILRCYNNSINALDLSDCPSLEYLGCSDNNIRDIDLRNNPHIREIVCQNNGLETLYVAGCSELEYIRCDNNSLTSLDLEGCSSLLSINCSKNGLTSFEIGHILDYVDCSGNPIKRIDVFCGGSPVSVSSAGNGYVTLCDTVFTATADPSSTFSRWIKDGTTISTDNDIQITQGGSYTAVFGYTVFYNANGATGGTAPAFAVYDEDDDITVAGNTGNLVKTGYTFGGWNEKSDGTGTQHNAGTTFAMPGNDLILHAQWIAEDYYITYDANGATTGAAPAGTGPHHVGDELQTQVNSGNLQKTNYTFTGWNTASNGMGTHYSAPGPITMPANNLVLYAEWARNYYVTYNANGANTGSAPIDPKAYHTGDTATVLGNTGGMTRTGSAFTGWNTSSYGNGTHYSPGDTIVIAQSGITLYAEWKVDHSVVYYSNGATGGSAPVDTHVYHVGDTVTVLGNTGNLVRTGYLFAGWNTSSYSYGTHYNPGDTIVMQDGDLRLYAQWRLKYSNDADKIKTFLNLSSHRAGQTNAQWLGFNPDEPSTWTGVTWQTVGDTKYLTGIDWADDSLDGQLAGTLDLSSCAYLSNLDVSGHYLTGLNVSGCTRLGFLDCYANSIATLTLGSMPALGYLECSYNYISSLNMSGCNNLQDLYCDYNRLTSLNLSGRNKLDVLSCSNNSLTSINLSGCTDLIILICGDNSLPSLNLASSSKLYALVCEYNLLTTLSLSQKLSHIYCTGNPMTSLNVTVMNGNGVEIPVKLNASGAGYVGMDHGFNDSDGLPTVVATPKSPCSFSKWTKSGKTVSTKSSFVVKTSGTYTANFAYTQGTYLSGVALSAGKISPAFSKTKTSYKVTIPENQASVTITPTKLNGALSMTINGKTVSNYTVSLANGKSATVKVKVSYGKSSKTYTFTVTRAKSTNNNLATLTAPGAVFDSPFNPADTSYTLTLAETTKSVKISATAAAGKLAKVSPASKTVSLSNGGKTTVKISVKSQAGKTKTYVITVKRAPSTNNNLSYLKTSSKSFPLSPKFSAATTNYNITLPVDKSTVTISAKAAGYKAGVKIDGKSASSKKITLKAGTSQTVRVVVKAQSGTEKVYTITVNRLISTDANLKSLKTSSKTAPLSPVFNPGVTSYTVNMPAKTSSVTLSASANGYGAKVTIDGKSASSKKITLKAGGEATVRIVVTAQNGNKKEYVITVKRPLA